MPHIEERVGGVTQSKDGIAQPSEPRGRQRATEEVAPEYLHGHEGGHSRDGGCRGGYAVRGKRYTSERGTVLFK